MAKGLRASSKVKARNARRYTTGTDYQVIHAARLNAISQRLLSQVDGKDEDKETDQSKEGLSSMDADVDEKTLATKNGNEAEKTNEKSEPMETSENGTTTEKKISTSGPRNSRREQWRKARGWTAKKGTKNGGKPKRRR